MGDQGQSSPPELDGYVVVVNDNYIQAGGFSTVWLGRWRDPSRIPPHLVPNQHLAIKAFLGSRLPQNAEKFQRRVRRETRNWHRLTHPNILPLYGICYNKLGCIPDFPALVSPYLDHGNIMHYIARYPRANRLPLIHQAANGLMYLHENGFVHGDLKGANILIRDDGQACLCDFGRTVLAGDDDYSRSIIASAHWTAPELLNPPDDEELPIPITVASDVWAFGMVVIEVITGQRPWGRLRDVVVLRLVGQGARPERQIYPSVPRAIWYAIERCWEIEPRERPSVDEVISRLPEN